MGRRVLNRSVPLLESIQWNWKVKRALGPPNPPTTPESIQWNWKDGGLGEARRPGRTANPYNGIERTLSQRRLSGTPIESIQWNWKLLEMLKGFNPMRKPIRRIHTMELKVWRAAGAPWPALSRIHTMELKAHYYHTHGVPCPIESIQWNWKAVLMS